MRRIILYKDLFLLRNVTSHFENVTLHYCKCNFINKKNIT